MLRLAHREIVDVKLRAQKEVECSKHGNDETLARSTQELQDIKIQLEEDVTTLKT